MVLVITGSSGAFTLHTCTPGDATLTRGYCLSHLRRFLFSFCRLPIANCLLPFFFLLLLHFSSSHLPIFSSSSLPTSSFFLFTFYFLLFTFFFLLLLHFSSSHLPIFSSSSLPTSSFFLFTFYFLLFTFFFLLPPFPRQPGILFCYYMNKP